MKAVKGLHMKTAAIITNFNIEAKAEIAAMISRSAQLAPINDR